MLQVLVERFLCAHWIQMNFPVLYKVIIYFISQFFYKLYHPMIIIEPKNEVNTIDVSVGGEYIVSGGKDATLRLYDAQTAKVINHISIIYLTTL